MGKSPLASPVEFLGGRVRLYHGDSREVLPTLSGIDLIATDPPYSSGGTMRSDRNMDTSAKYRLGGVQKEDPDFSGDNRDQRSLTLWFSDWMAMSLRATRKGGAMFCFIDWRNLPCVIDACQVGGWVYRGIVPWDKGEGTRPDKGWFRSQVEYVVTASAGPLVRGADAPGICQAGYLRVNVNSAEKEHITGKPVELMLELLRTRDDWETVCDPFMGSGTTGVAAVKLGRRFVGCEIEPRYFDIACRRIENATKQPDMFVEAAAEPVQADLGLEAAE
jgi:site-specific DNA-methyltransferase (adenine-specific)